LDDSGTTYARILGYESMSDVDTGTGLFPTNAQMNGGLYAAKPDATRAWHLFSDGRIIYLFSEYNGANIYDAGFVFGDFASYLSVDSYACCIVASTSSNGGNLIYQINSASSGFLARSYTQLGVSIASGRYSHGKITSQLGISGMAYPNPVDNSVLVWPIEVWEGSTVARGILPGFYNPIHNSNTPQGTTLTNIAALPGRTLLIQGCYSTLGFAAIDISGPWR
jgi:hypothetical protein